MLLAELQIFHSRPIAPTRRLAMGPCLLPTDPAPGVGAVLLGVVVARHMRSIDPNLWDDFTRLSFEIERGTKVAQPRLRFRWQDDRIGLTRSQHQLVRVRDDLNFIHDDENGTPIQQVLGALYSARLLKLDDRRAAMDVCRRGMRWIGDEADIDRLVAHLCGSDTGFAMPAAASTNPVAWAFEILGFDTFQSDDDRRPRAPDVQRRFRAMLLKVHPDHGGDSDEAASRIAELTEARRILLL